MHKKIGNFGNILAYLNFGIIVTIASIFNSNLLELLKYGYPNVKF